MSGSEGQKEKVPSLSHPRLCPLHHPHHHLRPYHHPCHPLHHDHHITTFIVSLRRGDEGGSGNAGGPCWLLPIRQDTDQDENQDVHDNYDSDQDD